jgi:predicted alpha/beta-fold hydrolase
MSFCATYKLIANPGFGNIISFFNASLINFLNAIFSRPQKHSEWRESKSNKLIIKISHMHIFKNILLPGSAGKPITLDIFFEEEQHQKPVVIYVHGFNGFKDWGRFDLVAAQFAKQGFVLVNLIFRTWNHS